MIRLCFFAFFLLSFGSLRAQQDYPVPTNMKDVLFYIQHDRGYNTFIYALNKTRSGKIDPGKPIKIYRQLFDEKGEIKPLTAIQRNFAYGITTKKVDANNYQFSIVSMPNQIFNLNLSSSNLPEVETTVNNKEIQVQHIFIQQTEGTTGLGTKVDYILFFGKNAGKQATEKLIPNDN